MTTDAKVVLLRKMLDPQDYTDEGVLVAYLELAGSRILNRMYPFLDNYDGLAVPDKYVNIQLNIACYMLNKRGAEGEIQHIENGIHRNYGSSDIPEGLLKDVTPYCQAIR